MSSPTQTSQTCSSTIQSNKRKLDESSDDDSVPTKVLNTNSDNFPKFIVLSSIDIEKPLTKISPFVINKTIQSVAGEVKKVSKMKNGNLLVECCRSKQSQNLLSLTSILDYQITASPHRSLNFSQGIIRDRDHDLSKMSEQEICEELKPQNITKVKRFTKKSEGKILHLNTYLLTFAKTSVPSHIYIGPYRIKVDTYVPNPTRCFKCQKFGHGKSSCRGTEKCVRCSEEGHSSFDCGGQVKCSNCGSDHMANSRNCSFYIKELNIQKLKTEKQISYQEARKLVSSSNESSKTTSYADKVRGPPATRTFETQTVFTWPNSCTFPVLVSEYSPSSSSASSQTSANTQAFNHTSTSATAAKAALTKQPNNSSPVKSNGKTSSQSNTSSTKATKQKEKNRSASADKKKTNLESNRLKKAEKSLLHQNQFGILSADDADNEEVMDTSSSEQIESVWGNYPNRGRKTGRTREGGRFTSCSPRTDEQRHGKISPIRAPPK